MVIGGRDLSAALLEDLQRQAAGLSLRQLGRRLCESLGLVGPGGKPQVSVAVQIVRTLVRDGVLTVVRRPAPCRSPSPRSAVAGPPEINPPRIEACLGIDLVVAWRIAHLTKLGRVPARPAWAAGERCWLGPTPSVSMADHRVAEVSTR